MRLPAAALLATAMLYMALCFGFYVAGARHLPATLAPNPYRAPAAIRAQLLAMEAPTARALPRLNPLTWLPHVLWERLGDRRPCDACRLPTTTARVVVSRDRDMPRGFDRHLAEIVLAIRIGRNWTLDDAANTLLAESRFRRDVIGIESAARSLFGVPANALRPQESLALIALMKAPSLYAPDCHRDRFEQRYAQLAAMLGHTGPDWTTAAALTRFRPHACDRR
jgi:hypothetical protein